MSKEVVFYHSFIKIDSRVNTTLTDICESTCKKKSLLSKYTNAVTARWSLQKNNNFENMSLYVKSYLSYTQLHTGVKPFCCSFPGCNHSYFQSSHLVQHEKTHQNDKSLFVCSMTDCGFSTKSVDEFKDHMKQMHSLVKQDTPVKLINRIPCTIPGCSKTFMNVRTDNAM